MGGYDYRITETSKTTVPFSEAALNAVPNTLARLTSDYQQNFVSHFLTELHAKTGITADNAVLENLVVTIEGQTATELHFLVSTRLYFHTLYPIHTMGISTLGTASAAVWTIGGLIKIVIEVLLIIGVIVTVTWAITQIMNSLKSLTTLTNESEVHDDNPTNPVTGEPNPYYCSWHMIHTESSNWGGTLTMIAIAAVVGVTVLAFVGVIRKRKDAE